MEGQGAGGNFFKRNWIAVVVIAVVALAGIGVAVYFTVIRDTTDERVITEDEKPEEGEPGDDEETGPEPVSKIVFERSDRIWIMNFDGTGQKQLTYTGNDSYPSLSPDGKYVVFVRLTVQPGDETTSEHQPQTSQLYLIGSDGKNVKRLTPASWATSEGWTPLFTVEEGTRWRRRNCHQPSFSNDGTSICLVVDDVAYQETPDGAKGWYGLNGIAVMSLDGTRPTGTSVVYSGQDLYGGEAFGGPEYSKNDRQIFFTYGAGGGPPGVSIERIDADGGNRAVIMSYEIGRPEGAPDRGYYAFDISPDGNSLVCVEVTIDQGGLLGQLILANIDGTSRRHVPTPGVNVGTDRVSFSPDGNRVAFVDAGQSSPEGGEPPGIYTMKIDGSDMKRVSREGDAPDWGNVVEDSTRGGD